MSSPAPALTLGAMPRVNLIPRSEIERRERASTARGWLWGIMFAILAALLIVAGAVALNWIAGQRLAAEQARTNDLLLELTSLSDVSSALSTESELTAFRAESMGSDFAWAPVIGSIQGALPAGVTLVGFDLVVGGVPQAGEPSAQTGLTGSLELASPNVIDIAQTVRGLRGVPGVVDADGRLVSTSSQGVGEYTYELTITFDQTVYSGAYAESEGGQ